jgi:acyl-coenzyme A synthetase/AMP-(fatty) acid ligase
LYSLEYSFVAFFTELVGPLSTSLGVCIFPPSDAIFHEDHVSVSSSYLLPMAPTAENIIENIYKTDAEAIFTVPTFLDQWATKVNQKTITTLRRLRLVGYAGGPLSYEKGQFLVNQGVKVRSLYGGTEVLVSYFYFLSFY